MPYAFTRAAKDPGTPAYGAYSVRHDQHVNDAQFAVERLAAHWYDVTQYGALGNNATGSANANRVAIQAAIAAVGAAGGVLYFPPGTYYTDRYINLNKSAVRVLGYGAVLKLAPAANSQVLVVCGNATADPSAGEVLTDVVVEGLTLDGNAANQTQTSTTAGSNRHGAGDGHTVGLAAFGCLRLTVAHVRVVDTVATGLQLNRCGEARVLYCTTDRTGWCAQTPAPRNGIAVYAAAPGGVAWAAGDHLIHGCTVSRATDVAIDLAGSGTARLRCTENSVRGGGRTLGSDLGGGATDDYGIMAEVHTDDATQHRHVLIGDNLVTGFYGPAVCAISYGTRLHGVVITGNLIHDTYADAIHCGGQGIAITGNVIIDYGLANNAAGLDGRGIFFAAEHFESGAGAHRGLTISGNDIHTTSTNTSNARHCIELRLQSYGATNEILEAVHVSGNTLWHTGATLAAWARGITVQGVVRHVSLVGNRIMGMGQGMEILVPDATINDNVVTGCYGGAGGIYLGPSTIDGSPVQASRAALTGNRCDNNTGPGIHLDGVAGAWLTGNVCQNTSGTAQTYGLQLSNSASGVYVLGGKMAGATAARSADTGVVSWQHVDGGTAV